MPTDIVDAHHHIWRRSDLPWLSGPVVPRIFGDYEAIRRDYPIDEYRGEAEALGVRQSVYVQVNWAPDRAVDEVAWAQAVADENGFPHAIVGYADLASPDAMRTVDAQMRYANFRGVRMQMHWHENPMYRFAPTARRVCDPIVIDNLRRLAERGLVFELQVFSGQLAAASEAIDAVPNLQFVLEHAGMPEDPSEDGTERWRHAIRAFADRPNVATKLSALGTFSRRNDPAFVARIVAETVAAFGPERCMWGSNFPIEKIWTSYADVLKSHLEATAAFTAASRAAIFAGTARRIYGLPTT